MTILLTFLLFCASAASANTPLTVLFSSSNSIAVLNSPNQLSNSIESSDTLYDLHSIVSNSQLSGYDLDGERVFQNPILELDYIVRGYSGDIALWKLSVNGQDCFAKVIELMKNRPSSRKDRMFVALSFSNAVVSKSEDGSRDIISIEPVKWHHYQNGADRSVQCVVSNSKKLALEASRMITAD